MKLRILSIAMIFGLCAHANVQAQSPDQPLNMEQGMWELTMKGEFMGNRLVDETTSDCTDAEDLNTSAEDILAELADGINCQADGINKVSNTYEGTLSCADGSPFEKGEFLLITSPRNISLYLKVYARAPFDKQPAIITALMHRTGPCVSGN